MRKEDRLIIVMLKELLAKYPNAGLRRQLYKEADKLLNPKSQEKPYKKALEELRD